MSSSAASPPTYMMFLNSWRWRASSYISWQMPVSGMPIAVTSSRSRVCGSGLVES